MADSIRNLDSLKSAQAIAVLNSMRLDMMKIKSGLIVHADASAQITTANASDLATSIALANALKASYNAHCASACDSATGQGSHTAADATNPTAVADATDLTSVEALLNDIKAKYNSHRALTTSHPTADGTNVVTAAAATDQASSNTLANDIKTQLNAHYTMAMYAHATLLVAP